jgi:endoglycosylceramidase
VTRPGPSVSLAALLLPLACAAASPAACSSSAPPPNPAPIAVQAPSASASAHPRGWHTHGSRLVDPDERHVLLRGVNVGGETKYTADHVATEREPDWAEMRAWGVSGIRLLVFWGAIEPERGVFDQRYLDSVRAVAAAAGRAGLWVVLDMHQDIFSWCFTGDGAPAWACPEGISFTPQSPWFLNYFAPAVQAAFDRLWTDAALQGELVESWRRMARAVAGVDAVIGFDLFNEPFPGTAKVQVFEPELLAPFYERARAAVLAEAPGRVAMASPNVLTQTIKSMRGHYPPIERADTVFSPHLYDAGLDQGQAYSGWTSWRQADFESFVEDTRRVGAPVVIGETGAIGSVPGAGQYVTDVLDAADTALFGVMLWAWGRTGGFGLQNPDGTSKDTARALAGRAYPVAVAGRLVSTAWKAADRSLTFVLDPEPLATAPTEVATPTALFPDQLLVRCEPDPGCLAVRSPDRARATIRFGGALTPAARTTVTMAPAGRDR